MKGSVSYDRIAHVYDATRALSESVQRKLSDALVAEFASAGAHHILDVGVGTGRIARLLAVRDRRVSGVDIGPRMLATLQGQSEGRGMVIDPVLGDATRLPFATASFRGVLVYHVLHLVSCFESAIRELRRVLAPGGVVICGFERWRSASPWDACTAKWKEVAASRGFMPRPTPEPYSEKIRASFQALGGSRRLRPYAEGEESHTPAETLERIRERIYYTWSLEMKDDVFADCLAEFEPWFRRYYGDMSRVLVQPVSYELEVWSFT